MPPDSIENLPTFPHAIGASLPTRSRRARRPHHGRHRPEHVYGRWKSCTNINTIFINRTGGNACQKQTNNEKEFVIRSIYAAGSVHVSDRVLVMR